MTALENPAARGLALVLTLVAVLLVAPACDDDDPVAPPPPIGPQNWQELMAGFVSAYEDLDIEGYRALVHPDFRIHLSQATVDEFFLPAGTFSYDEEVLIAERMFSGQPFVRPDQSIVPGITRIAFEYFEPETAWEVAGPTDRFPGDLCAQYRVEIRIEQGNFGLLTIRGIIEFAVRNEPVERGGTLHDRWQMVGQVDYTAVAAKRPVEDTSWGDLKALYR